MALVSEFISKLYLVFNLLVWRRVNEDNVLSNKAQFRQFAWLAPVLSIKSTLQLSSAEYFLRPVKT